MAAAIGCGLEFELPQLGYATVCFLTGEDVLCPKSSIELSAVCAGGAGMIVVAVMLCLVRETPREDAVWTKRVLEHPLIRVNAKMSFATGAPSLNDVVIAPGAFWIISYHTFRKAALDGEYLRSRAYSPSSSRERVRDSVPLSLSHVHVGIFSRKNPFVFVPRYCIFIRRYDC
jgi:hypothetical protein